MYRKGNMKRSEAIENEIGMLPPTSKKLAEESNGNDFFFNYWDIE